MHVNRNQIPVRIDVPGATARQAEGFGDPSGFGPLGGEYFSLGAGTDIAPLLEGLARGRLPGAALGLRARR